MSAVPEAKIVELTAALIAGRTVQEWARANDVPERTAFTWAARIEVKRAVGDAREAAIRTAATKLVSAAGKAAETITELMGPDHDPRVRLAAAKAVLAGLGPVADHVRTVANENEFRFLDDN